MRTLWLALGLAIVGAAGAEAAGTLTATLDDVKGEVTVREGKGAWQAVKSGRPLVPSEELSTGIESEATIKFSDGSSMTVRELTQLLVSSMLQTGQRKDLEVQLKLGEIKAQVKHEKALDTSFKIVTATATASVRGTEINEVSFHPARGMHTSLKTGSMLVMSPRGATLSRPSDEARVDARGNLQGPPELRRDGATARVDPVGLTAREHEQIGQSPQPRPFTPHGPPDLSRPEGAGPLVGRPPPPPMQGRP